mmetsp:Transcript_20453/g.78592  ORF Transcript_20453/g.78592 Transcript_20453/m.78592 type:complete len:298 (-) Transcript_20453:1101-1994(-)
MTPWSRLGRATPTPLPRPACRRPPPRESPQPAPARRSTPRPWPARPCPPPAPATLPRPAPGSCPGLTPTPRPPALAAGPASLATRRPPPCLRALGGTWHGACSAPGWSSRPRWTRRGGQICAPTRCSGALLWPLRRSARLPQPALARMCPTTQTTSQPLTSGRGRRLSRTCRCWPSRASTATAAPSTRSRTSRSSQPTTRSTPTAAPHWRHARRNRCWTRCERLASQLPTTAQQSLPCSAAAPLQPFRSSGRSRSAWRRCPPRRCPPRSLTRNAAPRSMTTRPTSSPSPWHKPSLPR